MSDREAQSSTRAGRNAAPVSVLDVGHEHVVAVQRELAYDNGAWRHVLVVLTDLTLDPNDPGHDRKQLDAMVQAVMAAARKAQTGFDVLTLRNA